MFDWQNTEDLPNKMAPPVKHLVDDGILAGSNTTASALTSLFFCLLIRPDTYASSQEEVDKFYIQETRIPWSPSTTKAWCIWAQ